MAKIIFFFRKNKKKIFSFLRIAVSISLIAFLIKTQFKDAQSLIKILKTVSIPWLILSASTHIFGIWITAVRWKALLRTQKINISTRFLTSTVLIGFFFNNFLPSTIGGDVFRTYDVAKKANKPLGTSASIIVVERFSGIISAATYAVIALFLGFTAIGRQSIIIPIIIFFTVCLILGFIIINPSILKLGKLVKKIKFLEKLKQKLSNIYNTFLSFKKYKMVLVKALIYSFLLQFAVILNYYLAARAIGINLSLTTFIFIVPVVAIIAMIPISIGGIGLRENSIVYIMVAMGVANEKAALCSLILFAMLIFIGIIGGIIYGARPYVTNCFSKKEISKMKTNKDN
jgi:uncharacterized protein (TIRG00374 family)